MTQPFSKIAFTVLAAFGMSASVYAACPTLQIKQLTLNADGTVTRTTLKRKDVDGQHGRAPTVKYIPVVRDQLKLEKHDLITLNASPTMVDASLNVEIYVKEQDRDEQGVFSTTYHVIEFATSSFGGPRKPFKTAYLAQVKSNYLGDGAYSNGCGEVIRTNLDLESSTDVRE